MADILRLDPSDNVVTALRSLQPGQHGARERIPRGHKMAVAAIEKGAVIRKYAQLIGFARERIASGEHVHTHNTEFRRAERDQYQADPVDIVESGAATDVFAGYRRASGAIGVRNSIAVISSVNCSATAARQVAEHFDHKRLAAFPNVDGVTAYVHATGCGMADSGEGFEALQRVMWGYCRNPNVAAVLMIGLGCEINQIDWLLEAYGLEQGPGFQVMNIQERCGLRQTVMRGIEKVEAMLPVANRFVREECPASGIKLALQCGGSDAWSGISANPALGNAVDRLVRQGGSAVLAETPEIYGAEHLLTARAASPELADKILDHVGWWEDYTERNRGSLNNNPSPGNKEGGLTTIYEKSLGAVAKGGTTMLRGVYRYAEEVTSSGFSFMDSPGYDPASVTGQIAGGCNLVAFTTGRGSAFGSKPSPCIKIATNSAMFERMRGDMDINAGKILDSAAGVEDIGEEIYRFVLEVASGRQSKSEAQGLGDYEFVPWQIGAVM
ncbi:MAG: altronate dehydratase family protein [Rhodobacteraceae bacterium]|nr:altronate dehydratase family protein [Paracoccaceae bacterium]